MDTERRPGPKQRAQSKAVVERLFRNLESKMKFEGWKPDLGSKSSYITVDRWLGVSKVPFEK
jgi:glutamate formiminotransferase